MHPLNLGPLILTPPQLPLFTLIHPILLAAGRAVVMPSRTGSSRTSLQGFGRAMRTSSSPGSKQ